VASKIPEWFPDFGKLMNPYNTALQTETETVMFINGIMDIEGG
jgi:hypothetical protein